MRRIERLCFLYFSTIPISLVTSETLGVWDRWQTKYLTDELDIPTSFRHLQRILKDGC